MSKSLGNVVDPVDTIAEYGTDALRYTLATGEPDVTRALRRAERKAARQGILPGVGHRCKGRDCCVGVAVHRVVLVLESGRRHICHMWLTSWGVGNTLGQDLNLSLDRVLASRNFANKLWNAGKFIDFNLAQVLQRNVMCTARMIQWSWLAARIWQASLTMICCHQMPISKLLHLCRAAGIVMSSLHQIAMHRCRMPSGSSSETPTSRRSPACSHCRLQSAGSSVPCTRSAHPEPSRDDRALCGSARLKTSCSGHPFPRASGVLCSRSLLKSGTLLKS